MLLVTLTTVLIGGTSDKYFVSHVQPTVQQVTKLQSEMINWVPLDELFGRDFNIIGNTFIFYEAWWKPAMMVISRPLEWLLPRIVVDPTETIWKPDEKAIQTEAKLAHATDWVEYFDKYGKGFQSATHSLRFAELSGQNLRKAQMTNAKLQGANLSGVELQGANLALAQLQGADFEVAQMQGAELAGAQLQGANLNGAKLQGANLNTAQLEGANLNAAELQGAELQSANLQGAFFELTQIVGIQNPSYATVFYNFSLTKDSSFMFNENKIDSDGWKELEDMVAAKH